MLVTHVIHFCHYIDTQGCWVLFESTNIKPLGHGENRGLKVLKMRALVVFLCGQRVNRVSSGLCDLCASLSLWGLLAPTRDTLHMGQMDLGGNTGKQQLLPCGVFLCCPWGKPCIRPAGHSLKHYPSTRKGDAVGRAVLQEDCKGTSMSSVPAAVDPKFHTAVSRDCIGAGCNSCFPEHSQCPVCCPRQLLTPRQRLGLT